MVTEEQAALAIAEATNCGYGDIKDGKHCRILCDNESLHPTMERMNSCDCRRGAAAVLALISSSLTKDSDG